MQKQIDLKTMSVEALKALAYDILNTIQVQQSNLQAINAEIEKKSQTEPLEEAKKEIAKEEKK